MLNTSKPAHHVRLLLRLALCCAALISWGAHARGDAILNRQSDKTLDANCDRATENGCPILLWDYLAEPQQDWRFENLGGGYFRIVCAASGLVLDANSDLVHENGCPVQLWTWNGGTNQQWAVQGIPGTDGAFKIVNRASGKVLDAHSPDVHLLNCRVQLWEDLAQPQQAWLIKSNQPAVANLGINSGSTGVSKRLRVLLVCDTTASGGIAEGVAANRDAWLKLIAELATDRPQRFTVDVIDGDDVSPDAVRDYYRNLTIDPGDALFFYYAGHGGWDLEKMANGFDEKGHYLSMMKGNLYRFELRDLMRAHQATAHFIITDACSSVLDVPPPAREGLAAAKPADWSIFQNLFFGHSGFYDVQGATRLEFGWYGDQGSIFTYTLTNQLCEPSNELGWNLFFRRIRGETLELFKQCQERADRDGIQARIRDVQAQTPEALYLGDWPGSNYSRQ